ncbi:DUF2856 family protein [Salmonella enterica]|nr:DUF2856 family protein [Salmonella enterica]
MPKPFFDYNNPLRCSGNSVSDVLDKFRKNYDLIMSMPQETKAERDFRNSIWLAERNEKELIRQTSIRPFRKAIYTKFIETDPRLRDYRSRYGAISNN